MKRIFNLLFAAVALIGVVSSCQKDITEEDGADSTVAYGTDLTIVLPADFSDTVPLESITCEIRTSTPEVRLITATHSTEDGKSVFTLDEALPEGKNILRAVRYTGQNATRSSDYSEMALGCIVNVSSDKSLAIPSTYNTEYKLFGEGTSTNPFRIASALNFAAINDMDRTDFYFQQIDSVDFFRYYGHESGFDGVCSDINKPFNGHFSGGASDNLPITNLAVRRYTEEQSDVDTFGSVNPAGLFCYVSGAVIENVIVDNPHMVGDEGVGGVVGLILGASGNKSATTVINGCQVIRSVDNDNKIYGTACVGGVVGAIEYEGNAIISNCSVAKDVIIRVHTDAGGGNYLGGIIGASGLYATLAISNCVNNAYIEGDGVTNIGGIIGAAQTIKMLNCVNNGDVKLLNGTDTSIAVGGLIGGSTDAMISGSSNNGAITGTRGVGGLIGSSLTDTDPESGNDMYGSITVYASHNYGDVKGTQGVGGIAGEGQVAVVKSYNEGYIGLNNASSATYTEAEVGGMVGFASFLVASGSHNAGQVHGVYSGGISGLAEHFFVYACTNFGFIDGSYTGGIVGKTCEYGIMNYCSNFSDIYGTTCAGGIAGQLGDHLSTADKLASWGEEAVKEVVLLAVKVVIEGACMGLEHGLSKPKVKDENEIFVTAELTDDTFTKKSGSKAEVIGYVPILMDVVEVAWYISLCIESLEEMEEYEEEVEEYAEKAEEAGEEAEEAKEEAEEEAEEAIAGIDDVDLRANLLALRDEWQSAASDGADAMNATLSTKLDDLIANSTYWYRGDMPLSQKIAQQTLENIRSYVEAIDNDEGEISTVDNALCNNSFSALIDLCETNAKARVIEEVFACIEKCAIAAISVVCGRVVSEALEAASFIKKAAASFSLMAAGTAGTIAVGAQSEFTEDAENTIIMNQCSNFGSIEGNGIVGEIGDRVYIKNILSAGTVKGYAVANEADGKNLYDVNIISIGSMGRALYPDKDINSIDNKNIFVYGDGTNGTCTASEMKSRDTYGDSEYKGDDDWSWGLWSMGDGDEIPLFGQFMYFDFM